MSVTVEQYNEDWPNQFLAIKNRVEPFLQGVDHTIEHVGSTSVPGLAAKPIIDVDIVVAEENVQAATDALTQKGGFDHLGDLGITGRQVFKDPEQDPRRNIYVVIEGVAQTRNHLALRDTLRSNKELREEYAKVKIDLAAKGTNIIDYLEAKGTIIVKILRASGQLSEEELSGIIENNKKGEKFSALKTERLLLREFVSRDIDAYYELESNEENARYQTWPPRTKEQARQLVLDNIINHNATPRRNYELAVEHEGRFVGRVGAKFSPTNSDKLPMEKTIRSVMHVDMWFSFLPEVQGQGFATEAMYAFIEALTEKTKGAKDGGKWELEIECDPRNTASWKVAEKLGFDRHSLTKEAYECKGEWVDSLVYRRYVGDSAPQSRHVRALSRGSDSEPSVGQVMHRHGAIFT